MGENDPVIYANMQVYCAEINGEVMVEYQMELCLPLSGKAGMDVIPQSFTGGRC